MLRKLFSHTHHATGVAYLALFVALGGTGAYAANTIGSSDIIDGEVKSVDIGNNEIGSSDVKDNSLNTFDVHSFLGVDVVDGSLTGADIAGHSRSGTATFLMDLSTAGSSRQLARQRRHPSVLSAGRRGRRQHAHRRRHQRVEPHLPPTTTATFAGPPSCRDVASRHLHEGRRQDAAGRKLGDRRDGEHTLASAGADVIRDTPASSATAAASSAAPPTGGRSRLFKSVKSTLSMNGGAQVPRGGGEVSLWCKVQGGGGSIDYAQMMIIRIDGFF